MVGIVIVSHSKKIADGLYELIDQMTGGKINIGKSGGTKDGRLGTNIDEIIEEIKRCESGDGVLVLVDLGSSVMSAQMALEFLGEDYENKVKIADAPLVEGAIAASVEASIGSDIIKVKAVAEAAKNFVKI
ncbi:dihydroxyacetone kinase phosphoryl donor subunit DhaM [Thermoanaerobacterium thermosaccharolyticum]|uniref:dihydroxyacetone kinase phosphoryl donor subunit DhaM n=1 Tax=Thermoanaerobacterium thermosaccharolyticum TaxID=1517 RepID=UPI0017859188|nr:dihydroxyacetone kinase phosphoryl donor subunit DhaM [Thermoanaerobacterium thermosaccharolyticum]MBE0068428.1 PTS-dependent dihydroxyacetone kinase phosphotransferase subunit DhaM [Thermoanaerobacterium thermosaccharolyticum]MBE0228433.1 PTS-dependent dihydroxyacetone kinase phosphotransferase subunit DhaM [Thermoanaerobacterium thermosaccharolyticum]